MHTSTLLDDRKREFSDRRIESGKFIPGGGAVTEFIAKESSQIGELKDYPAMADAKVTFNRKREFSDRRIESGVPQSD